MGRIIVQTEVTNPFDGDKSIRCGMLVDTGAGALILPLAWKERFGTFRHSEPVELQLANREVVRGEACGPVRIRMEGFRPIFNEAIFPESEEGDPEPLLGYVILDAHSGEADHPFRDEADHRIRSSRSPVGAKRRGAMIMPCSDRHGSSRSDVFAWSLP